MLYINATLSLPPAVDPAELLEVAELVAAADSVEPIRTHEELNHVGRLVAITGQSQRKSYAEEWPIIKADYLSRMNGHVMQVVRQSQLA